MSLRKKVAALAIVYYLSSMFGLTFGCWLYRKSASADEVIGAMLFLPLLNGLPIIAGSADRSIELTLICWAAFPVVAILFLRFGWWWALGFVAPISFLMNLSTMLRYWGMMSV